MSTGLVAVLLGFVLDWLIGDPHSIPHPVVAMGKEISFLEKRLRRRLSKTPAGEFTGGLVLWLMVAIPAFAIPYGLLFYLRQVSVYLALAVESIMCWQILAVRSLRVESMKVHTALQDGDLPRARYAVSMIVGRDTERLDEPGVIRATVETVAENTSDGIVAPLLCLVIGGAPLGFFFKAASTMDSMLGYTDPPYTYFGRVSARMDDLLNFLPARLTACLMLLAGALQKLDVKNGYRILRRDRYRHASPNAAHSEAVCAGLLRVELGGDAWYHGVLHRKEHLGDPLREIEREDIPAACRLSGLTAVLALLLFSAIRLLLP